jgi:predicted NUDIX family NTP pyrophosphohydrolase
MYRHRDGRLEVLLAHPGGPFWARKDAGVWSIPKGECGPDEDVLVAAKREFLEELGVSAEGQCLPLGEVTQKSGKIVTAFALAGEFDAASIVPGLFEMEWPPKSGRRQSFPEVDRVAWFGVAEAREKIVPAQAVLIDRLLALVPAEP